MVARRDVSKEITVARNKMLVAAGRRAGDSASPDKVKTKHTYNIYSNIKIYK